MKNFSIVFLIFVLLLSFSGCEKEGVSKEYDLPEFKNSSVITENNSSPIDHQSSESKTNSDSSSNSVSSDETPFDSSTQNPNIDSDVSSSNNTETSSSKSYQILPGITDMTQEELRPNFWLGNNKKLSDDVLVVILFIDDNESHWAKQEIDDFTETAIKPALAFLEDEAKKHNNNLKFKIESLSKYNTNKSLKYDGTVNRNLNVGGSSKDVLDQAAQKLGFENNWDIYSYYKNQQGENDLIFLNLLNKDGISYARNCNSIGYAAYAEHAVIFSRYLGEAVQKDRASTVAHEILHLFGAEDMYTTFSRELLATRFYYNDIMLLSPNLSILTYSVGDLTAYSVGWYNTPPELCYNELWWQ